MTTTPPITPPTAKDVNQVALEFSRLRSPKETIEILTKFQFDTTTLERQKAQGLVEKLELILSRATLSSQPPRQVIGLIANDAKQALASYEQSKK